MGDFTASQASLSYLGAFTPLRTGIVRRDGHGTCIGNKTKSQTTNNNIANTTRGWAAGAIGCASLFRVLTNCTPEDGRQPGPAYAPTTKFMTARVKKRLLIIASGMFLLLGEAACQLPSMGAAQILHPLHRRVVAAPPTMCRNVAFRGDGVSLQGWRGQAAGTRRGTLIYLHGIAENRASGAGVMEHYRQRGFDVVAYDSRAQGESAGDASTYGFYEKEDLRRVMDAMKPGPIVLIGSSYGAAVALQNAAVDRRVSAVVAAETFSDLRTVVRERAPFFFTPGTIDQTIRLAELKGHFQMDAVSPVLAARTITAPVLLVHGALDTATRPDHSRRVFAALAGPKRLILVPGAGHNESLQGKIWEEIDCWLDSVLGARDLRSVVGEKEIHRLLLREPGQGR